MGSEMCIRDRCSIGELDALGPVDDNEGEDDEDELEEDDDE